MNERQLDSLRQDPDPGFAARLRRALDEQEPRRSWLRAARLRSVAAPVVAVVALSAIFSIPAVRASAQSLLALFRVVNFVAVPVDEGRLAALESSELDPPHLLGKGLEVLESAGPPLAVASLEQAGETVGFAVQAPTYLPTSTVLAGIEVTRQGRVRVTADAARLSEAMDVLGIEDLRVPEGLDGQEITATIPPTVTIRYERGGVPAGRLLQARSPEIALPEGVDLAALGEIGLRILGLTATDAREFAQAIDWSTTLLVPLPSSASSFKQVDIDGRAGVLVERTQVRPDGALQRSTMVLWSSGGQVYAVDGFFSATDTLRMAESLQ